jgi:hypothetical protein
MRGRVNYVTAEEAQGAKDSVLGTFLINSVPATVLFDFGHHIHLLLNNSWQSMMYP